MRGSSQTPAIVAAASLLLLTLLFVSATPLLDLEPTALRSAKAAYDILLLLVAVAFAAVLLHAAAEPHGAVPLGRRAHAAFAPPCVAAPLLC